MDGERTVFESLGWQSLQRIANCIYLKDGEVLLLQKPRRNWWAIPGGKMEIGETVKESAIREFQEETGNKVIDPELKGIYTFIIKEDQSISEWMMFTFLATQGEGTLKELTEEGILKWHPIDQISTLPMAEGDQSIIRQALFGEGVAFGKFEYTADFELLSETGTVEQPW